MKIARALLPKILSDLKTGSKGVVIYGPRQVGKTTLVNDALDLLGVKSLILNGDERGTWWEWFTSREHAKINQLVSGYEVVFIDEAQRIPEVGLSLKILLDSFPQKKVIVTGSSSLDLASKISEPLTGRVNTYKLFSISQGELSATQTPLELATNIEERLIYGSYPEIFSIDSKEKRTNYLRNLTNAYLYKDLLDFGNIRNSNKIYDLLKLLAFQVGSQVSTTELATSLELSRDTVTKYIDLLEKSFVIFRLSGFSRNLRKEVTKMDKIYFYDLGVRNAIIGNLHPLADRDDVGKLWENFLVVERIKRQAYAGILSAPYFWRLNTGAELDFVEDAGGSLSGFEFKYTKKNTKQPMSWSQTYPQSTFELINTDNWLDFVI